MVRCGPESPTSGRALWQRAGKLHMQVERITGGTVPAFVSGIDTNADVATEAFYLKPRD